MSTAVGGALSQRDAAAYIGKSVRQLQRLSERGDVTPIYLDSKPSYLRSELDELLANAPTTRPE